MIGMGKIKQNEEVILIIQPIKIIDLFDVKKIIIAIFWKINFAK